MEDLAQVVGGFVAFKQWRERLSMRCCEVNRDGYAYNIILEKLIENLDIEANTEIP